MGAVLACGQGAVLSHRSAATLHGLLDARGGRVEVSVPRRSPVRKAGIRAHRSSSLAAADCSTADRIPCTTVPATLLALAATSPKNVLESACNQAEIEGVLDMRAIGELLDRRVRGPGTSRLRAALDVEGLGLDRTRSALERRSLRLLRETGVPLPRVNEWVAIPGEEMQFDFVWHRQRLVVELDGWQTHRTRRAFRNDRRRDRLLRLAGWDVLRFTSDDVGRRPDEVVDAVRRILAGRGAMDG